jgi:long-chain fatty acid transport protein
MPDFRAVVFAAFLSLLVVSGHGHAAGFDNYIVGIRAGVTNNPIVSLGEDPSTVYWNPAGMAFQEANTRNSSTYFYVSHLGFKYSAAYDNGTTFKDETVQGVDGIAVIPGGFTVRKQEDWAYGYGFYIPYAGAGSSYTNFQDSGQDLEAFAGFPALTASVGYRVNDKLAVGGGVSMYLGIYEATNGYQFSPGSSAPVLMPYKAEFSDFLAGYSAHVGILYQASDRWTLGMTVRSEVPIEMDGDETIGGVKSHSTMEFTLPHEVETGVGFRCTERLRLTAFVSRRNYGDLKEFDFEVAGKVPTQFKDAWTVVGGFEYKLDNGWEVAAGIKWMEGASKRAGVHPATNDIEYFVPAFSVSYPLSDAVKLETGYQLTYGPTDKVNNQTFDVQHHTLMFGVSF